MYLNGETEAQVAQADRLKTQFKGRSDRDQKFRLLSESEIPGEKSNAATADSFVFNTTVISLAPKLLLLLPLLVLHVPAALVAVGYVRCLQRDGEKVEAIARTPSFHVVCTVILLLAAPAGIVVLLSLAYDYLTMMLWNVAYYVVVRGP